MKVGINMKAEELYYLRMPKYTTNNLSILSSSFYSHIPEIPDFLINCDRIDRASNIIIKFYADEKIDKRQRWILASVWFKEEPIMIIQNGGNEGDEIAKKFVTDIDGYQDMIRYINNRLRRIEFTANSNVRNFYIAKDEDVPNLDSFGGYSLDNFIENK